MNRRVTFWATNHPNEPGGYQQCLPSYCSVCIAASVPPQQTPASYTYANCCSLATKAGICTPVLQLDVNE
ncbi:hypothetical protein TNCV_58991 [Trichonephila clavipes]|nr:hypothetical protein TNCV_58991 [Trichonephila clavipes]